MGGLLFLSSLIPVCPVHNYFYDIDSYSTASFIGGIIVPLALILLGVSFARLKVPRPLSRLPWAAMLSVAAVKMVIVPICGIFIVQAMTRNGMIRPQAKAQKFVAVLLSGTPASVK
jgi:predicted permease